MNLTHDKIRALRAMHEQCMLDEHNAGECADTEALALHAAGVALCDEWLARRTVRWTQSPYMIGDRMVYRITLSVVHGGDWFGSVADHGAWRKAAPWSATVVDGLAQRLATEAEARAWLEERACEAGYEVAR